jgi:hypothetical protein
MLVTPAKAGVHVSAAAASDQWIPAFAGMTAQEIGMTALKPELPSPYPANASSKKLRIADQER